MLRPSLSAVDVRVEDVWLGLVSLGLMLQPSLSEAAGRLLLRLLQLSLGLALRPSLSGFGVDPVEFSLVTVAGAVLWPSLSEAGPDDSRLADRFVAGASAPAFVERSRAA